MANQSAGLDPLFHALSDQTRRAVVARLSRGPASVGELAKPFDLSLPSLLKHLKVLEAGGLITTTKTGRVRSCALNAAGLSDAERWLVTQRVAWMARFDRLDEFLLDQKKGEDI